MANLFNSMGKQAGKVTGKVRKRTSKLVKGAGKAAGGEESKSHVDLFNSKLRKKGIDDYNEAVERYEEIAKEIGDTTQSLYDLRKLAIVHLKYVEQRINQLANTPKEFEVELKKVNIEIANFENKEAEIKEAEKQAKAAAGSSGTSATIGALGIAVATMGPTAAMGVATTFGVASTGTAISTLSGAAASNAALAWIGGGALTAGGGALTAGGGGMSAGTVLLGLAGPVGWTIAGVAGATAIGSGIFASHKNKEIADKLLVERQNLEKVIYKFNKMATEVKALIETTQTQIAGVEKLNRVVTGSDYNEFTKEEKFQVGLLVNSTLTLAQLINKELVLDD